MKTRRQKIIEMCLGRWASPADIAQQIGASKYKVIQALSQINTETGGDCLSYKFKTDGKPRSGTVAVKASYDPCLDGWPAVNKKRSAPNMGDALKLMRVPR